MNITKKRVDILSLLTEFVGRPRPLLTKARNRQ